MGFLNWWKRATPVEDPLLAVVKALIEEKREERQQLEKLTTALIDTQRDQNATTRMLLEQYMGKGDNQATGLDERLFMAENDEATDWEPVLGDPFRELGM